MRRWALAAAATLAAALAVTALLQTRAAADGSDADGTDADDPGPAPGRGEAATTAAAAAAAIVAAPAASRDPTGPRDGQLALPDDTFVPCLNGARGAPDLRLFWGDRPFSPIVSIERTDLGIDWYVHADGSRTTTEMKWRADLGRFDAMTRVAVPVPGTPAAAIERGAR
jgi:hypothetical protein